MAIVGRLRPVGGSVGWAVALGVLMACALALRLLSGPGEMRYVAAASIERALPSRGTAGGSSGIGDGGDAAGAPANPAFTSPAADPVKPAAPDLELVEASPFGPLPRVAADGRRPLPVYGRPYDPADARPKVALVVIGLGLRADATSATLHLPGAVSLSFSPYTEDLPSLFERARLAGHEVLLELPMEPSDYPANDPGPHTLRASGTVDANIERLTWVLSRAPGYVAVAGRGGVFAASPEAVPVVKAIAAMGIGMIEIDGNALAAEAATAGLAYAAEPMALDATPAAGAIDQALAALEAKARAEGSAIGVAEAYPITLQHLADWAAALDQRGLALVPVSAVLIDRADRLRDDKQASNLVQTRN